MCALVPGFQSFALPVSVLLGRFRRPVRQIARPSAHVELPAVIDAAQPALLVAPVVEVRAAMRAARLHETHPAEAVAERDQVLAEDADANRRPVRLRQLRGEHGGLPVPPETVAPRRTGAGAGERSVVRRGAHGLSLSSADGTGEAAFEIPKPFGLARPPHPAGPH